ncbi:YfiT family bacillithiol transferase [Paenibacillus sp. NPDC058071]|uniref:YfiT family bacillithiol transferase n=1 Tax=Paenibacillus sp. NPDC058071 TaxID=3346326 RepID=UPI0036D93A56
MEKLRYPIGKFVHEGEIGAGKRAEWMDDIAALPKLIAEAVEGLSEEQLNTPYRDGGWSVRQVVHHVADSHMNSFFRFKLALTEANPTIKAYEEKLWAELADSSEAPVTESLAIIEGLHSRWVRLLRAMTAEQYERTFYHPGYGQTYSLATLLGMYSWHGRHHLAHIVTLKERSSW